MKKNIVWLASYPKSGNTWTRIFLANYIRNGKDALPINEVPLYGMGDSIARTYFAAAGRQFDTRDMGLVVKLREKVLRGIAGNNADVNFVKTHSINKVAAGHPLIPHSLTKSAIYVVRNPLDMVLSYAKHYALTHEQATLAICHKDNALQSDQSTVGSLLGTWSDHARSWAGFHPYTVLVLRYEDMLDTPVEQFRKVLIHIGMPVDEERLARAVRFSGFDELKKQEEKSGFVEKARNSDAGFFRKGQSGQWREELAPELVAQIRKVNAKAMKRFGYYDI